MYIDNISFYEFSSHFFERFKAIPLMYDVTVPDRIGRTNVWIRLFKKL